MIRKSECHDERGAITIQVAFSLIALIVFCSFVFDQGVMLVARRQAQNAADAGALAAVGSLIEVPGNSTLAAQAARQFASQPIWGQSTAAADIIVSPIPFPCPASAGGGTGCVRVDVLRGMPDRTGTAHNNTLPTYFASIGGLLSQGVRATATAQIAAGNAVTCIKPWVVADKWIDNNGTTHPPGGWDQYDSYQPGIDAYSPPGFKATGPNNDYGLELVLKEGVTGSWSSGWTMQVDFGVTGSNVYRDEISGCPDFVPTVGLYDGSISCASKSDTADPSKGCLSVKTGMAQGPTSQGIAGLIALDPSATWDPTTNTVSGGCMVTGTCVNPTGSQLSPRIAPIAIFNTGAFATEAAGNDCSGSTCVAQVVNLIGFFVEGMCNDVYPNTATRPAYCGSPAEANKAVVGRLMKYTGTTLGSAGSATGASFVVTTRLVR